MSTRGSPPHSTPPGAFGLAISSDAGIPGLDAPCGASNGRRAEHRLAGREALAERLREGELERMEHSGKGAARVEYQERSSGDVLIRTKSFGDHLIADAGRTVLSSVAGADPDLWRRYVLGQVLPLTASIQGLEIFHAGAVAIDGSVVVLAGPSGAGKSSVAGALVASGAAAFFADDVLAVDATSLGLTGYPGSTLMGVPRDRAAALAGGPIAGPPWIVDEKKVLAPVRGERRPLPVLAFFRLTPDGETAGISFGPCLPNRLMATTFDGVSRTSERLLRLLRVGAMLAAGGRAQELRYQPGSDPQAVAGALLRRLEEPL